jgi:succinate-semialdehyde dehydrogenase / glutarate-semialdehyde dehydrogenase
MSGAGIELTRRELIASVPKELFIGGEWRGSAGGDTMSILDPSSEEVLCDVADAIAADGLDALDAAVRAQLPWARTAPRTRSDILRRACDALLARVDELALLMTMEMGKPLSESRGEVAYAADFFRWFSEEAVRIDGGYSRTPDGRTRTLVLRQPVGPCLLITPWNFPLAMGARKIGPAIAAGCTMVLKPAPQTPLSSLMLASVLEEAGLPPGVLNVITTSRAGDVVAPILKNPDLRKLSFTGSTAVGRHLLQECSDGVVRASMELGGNAPFIVFADADLDVALDAAMQAKMRNMGEACTAANRFFVHSSVIDEFAFRLGERMGALTVAPGYEVGSEVGPLIDQKSLDKVAGLVDEAITRGAKVLVGGSAIDGPGYFFQPTVLNGVDAESSLNTTEIFGPVAALRSFESDDEVVGLANDTEWGLVAYIFTRDLGRAFDVSERLEVGMVGLNVGIVSNPAVPFGGVKQSGLGREGGHQGIDDYLEYKLIALPVESPVKGRDAGKSR